MKYFIDTEFIEGFRKPWLGKKAHFIDLISIGIVAENGKEYYAISSEFDPKEADTWVYENVLNPLLVEWVQSYSGDCRNRYLDRIANTGKHGSIRVMQKFVGKSLHTIAEEILRYIAYNEDEDLHPADFYAQLHKGNESLFKDVQFYGYYADYDWVVFCSLFGTMVDLPKGFPMYCKDLKQMLDDKVASEYTEAGKLFEAALSEMKSRPNYPKQLFGQHNALEDARWNYELYKFLKTSNQYIH